METVKFNHTDAEFNKVLKELDKLTNKIISDVSITLDQEKILSKDFSFISSTLGVLQGYLSQMDSAMNDYYHILGMSNLDASRMMLLTSKFKKLLETRNDLKHSISILSTLKVLMPQFMKRNAEYTPKVLGKTTLRTKTEEELKNV